MMPVRPTLWHRLFAILIDIVVLGCAVASLVAITVIIYLNVAIFVYGTYERRIPDGWVELLIVIPAIALAMGIVWFYFGILRSSGGTMGQRFLSRYR